MDEQLASTVAAVRDQVILWMPTLVAGILTFLGFWTASKIVRYLIRKGLDRAGVPREVAKLVGDIAAIVILIFGLVTALGTLGIDIGAMIAGLGLTGFALGFALQDIVANTLAGFLLLLYRPFKAGDRIKVASWEGFVKDIDLRYMTIDTGSDLILIPNKKLFEEAITVYGKGAQGQPVTLTGQAR